MCGDLGEIYSSLYGDTIVYYARNSGSRNGFVVVVVIVVVVLVVLLLVVGTLRSHEFFLGCGSQ